MNRVVLLVAVLAAALAGALAATLLVQPRPPASEAPALSSGETGALRAEIARLEERLSALERARPLDAGFERTNPLATAPAAAGSADAHDPRWYLDQYVLSFAQSPEGSEYFRLAVDAYVVELRAPICELAADAGRVDALRGALCAMLGQPRFRGDLEIAGALLGAVRPPASDLLALRALQSLDVVGDLRAESSLEGLLFALRAKPVRERALAVIVRLAGEQANAALLRLFLRAPDDAWRATLIARLDGVELAAALDLLRAAAGMEQPVRLAAARKIGEYPEDEFQAFVADWLRVETDPEVIEALHGAQKQQKDVPGWHALKACGPPDANPKRDDPNAWASASGDMGLQWLELTYATAVHASGVRIYEVNAPGAVAEVKARTPQGDWRTLWSGTANGNGAPLLLEWPATDFDVQTIRLVLDTDRTPGWNEIDAVELLGNGGAQWARHASASSSYAGGRNGGQFVGGGQDLQQLLLQSRINR